MISKGVTDYLSYAKTPFTLFTLIGRGSIGPTFFYLFLFLVCLLILYIIQRRTLIGRSIYLMGENKIAARLAGIQISRTVVFIYAISGLMAAIGAIVFNIQSVFGLTCYRG